MHTMLAAVQQRLSFVEPKTQSPEREKVMITVPETMTGLALLNEDKIERFLGLLFS